MSETLYRKYRPATFEDLAGQSHVKTTLENQVASQTVAHAYLFTGPRGVGKTTTARLLAKAVNCENRKGSEPCNECAACLEIASGSSLDVLEIDAASNTGVDNVRENVIEAVRFAPSRLKRKVYIIDEVHMLSTASFNALLKTLEEPPAHALFILATTEAHKVPATVASRCQRFDFSRLPVKEIVARLKKLAAAEKVQVDEEVMDVVARHADGGLRDAESLFGQVLGLANGEPVTMKLASLVLPASTAQEVQALLAAIDAGDAQEAVRVVNTCVDTGVEPALLAGDIVERLKERLEECLASQNTHGAQQAARAAEAFVIARREAKSGPIPVLALELAIVKLLMPVGDSRPAAVAPKQPSAPSTPSPSTPASGLRSGNEKEAPIPPSAPSTPRTPQPTPPTVSKSTNETPPPIPNPQSLTPLAPTPDFDTIKRRWSEVLTKARATNASLPIVLQNAELTGIVDGFLELTFHFGFHADTVNAERNRRVIEQLLKEVFQADILVRGIHHPADAAVNDILQEFGGSLA